MLSRSVLALLVLLLFAVTGFATVFILYVRRAVVGPPVSAVGVEYISSNANVSGVFGSLHAMVGAIQHSACQQTRAAFDANKAKTIAALKLTENPVTCDTVTVYARATAAQLAASLRAADPTIDSTLITRQVEALWTYASHEVCDAGGHVDPVMLDAFVTKLYDAVCAPP